MSNASRDQNNVPALIGVLNTNGTTVTPIQANASTHELLVGDANTGSDHGPAAAARDENNITSIMAVSSADGVTPVVLYADSSGNLLIDSS